MDCRKCHTPMTKKAVLMSGNSKYQQWQCGSCRGEMTQAIGLTAALPKDHLYGTG